MMGWADVSLRSCRGHVRAANIFPDGFFDAGMLLQALKANKDKRPEPSDVVAAAHRRRAGTKLSLSEY